MPQFRKSVIAPGRYVSPDGETEVTPARIRHWHDSLKGMIAAGYKPPLSWGHISAAVPASDDDKQFWAARWNAGKLTGSEIDPKTGELYFLGDAPGVEVDKDGRLVADTELPDGRKVKAAIEEVSIGAADWTDGQGRVWKDAPIHLALTPLPVWVPQGGQPPFESTKPQAQLFSLARCLYRFATGDPPMAEEKKEEGKEEKKEAPPEKKKEGEEGADPTPMKDVLADLADYGIVLPDDTDDSNLKERLCIALKALKGKESGAGGEEEEEPVTEEPANDGTFMSTIKDPILKGLAAHMAQEQTTKRLARIDALVKRGLPPPQAKALRTEATTVRFAVAADGKPKSAAVDEKLDLLEGTLPSEWDVLTRSVKPTVETPPEGESGNARHRKVADEWAKNTRMPARAK